MAHDIAISDTGICIGWGKTFSARCSCGWWGHPELYRFVAVGDGKGHQDIARLADEAVKAGAV